MGKDLCLRVVNGLGLKDEIHEKLRSLAAYTKNGRVIAFSSWKNLDFIVFKSISNDALLYLKINSFIFQFLLFQPH